MTKHQLVNSQVTINDVELLMSTMTKEEMEDYIKEQLAYNLAEFILKNNIGKISKIEDRKNCSTMYRLSLVSINPDDYKDLYDAVVGSDFNILKDGEVISLMSLL